MKFTTRGLLGLLALITSVPPALSAEAGYQVTQIAKGGAALSGGMTLYITPQGLRTVDPKNGVCLMTRGPQWTVYIFNDKTKRLFQSPLQPWLQSFKTRNLVGRFEGASWRRGRQGAVAGVNAYEFVMDKPPPVRTTSKAINGKLAKYGGITSASLWVASDIVTPPQVSEIMARLYGVPDCQRIPLRVLMTETGKPPQTAVDTTRIARMTVPDSVFAVPSNYTPCKQDSDVFIDKESMDTLDEMLSDIDSPPKRRPAPAQGTRVYTPQRR